MHTIAEYKVALVHLGRGLAKCNNVKNSLIGFFANSEQKFRNFETHLGQLQDDLNKIKAVEEKDWMWFRGRVLSKIKKCIDDLKGIKQDSEGIVRLSQEDEKVIMWEEKGIQDILNGISGQDKRRLETMKAMLIELFGEVKDLSHIATHQVVEAVNPEIEAFGKLAEEVEQFTEKHKREAYEGVREKVKAGGGKDVQEIIIVFKYIALGEKKIKRDEAVELREIKTISELESDVDALMNKMARELGRVVDKMDMDTRKLAS